MPKTKKVYFFEVSVSRDGTAQNSADPYKRGDKCHWVQKGEPRETFIEAQQDAIANGERPYRISHKFIDVPDEAQAAA